MRFNAAPGGRWLRLVVAAAATVGVLAVGCGLASVQFSALAVAHPPHALLATLGGEFAVNVDHPHMDSGLPHACQKQLASAILPRSATALDALGVVVAVVATAGLLTPLGEVAARGPPRALTAALAGQDVLTRFCLSRR